MNILKLLSKLGILRYGTKTAVYHSGKDMPPELLMHDIANAECDLTTREDIKNVLKVVKGGRGDAA